MRNKENKNTKSLEYYYPRGLPGSFAIAKLKDETDKSDHCAVNL